MSKKEKCMFAFSAFGGLGGLACVLQWLGITPRDLSMTPPVTVPHILWLIVGMALFAMSLWLSLRAGFFQKITINHLQDDLSKRKDDLKESARRNLEYRTQILENLSDSVSDSDPRVYPEFTDARGTTISDEKENQAYFTLVNRGASEARNIILEPIEMDGKIVQFTRHRIAAPLLPKREAYFYPDVVTKENKSATGWGKDLFSLFYQDYLALGDSTICEATKLVKATYQDSARNLFEVTCELVLNPSAHLNVRLGNRGPSPVICTRNHRFRKVAKAIPLLDGEKVNEARISLRN
jgi:hypothetical protein